VTLGVAGSDRSEIKSGVKLGQQVVLAQLSAPIPSSTSSVTGRIAARFAGGGVGVGSLGARAGRH